MKAEGNTARFTPIAAFTAFTLLTGARAGEAQAVRWEDIDLAEGNIYLEATATKTRTARAIGLNITPQLAALLAAMKLRAGSKPYVFGGDEPLSRANIEAARERLVAEYGAPAFSWQTLRSTCATVQTNATSLFGDASAWKSARRLGHSVIVAERRYAGLLEVPKDATTLEQATGVDEVMPRVIERVSGPARPNVIALEAAR
jgi:integrase